MNNEARTFNKVIKQRRRHERRVRAGLQIGGSGVQEAVEIKRKSWFERIIEYIKGLFNTWGYR